MGVAEVLAGVEPSNPGRGLGAVDPFAKWPDGRIYGMFECKPQPLQWFARDRLLKGRGHVLTGVGGTSKTQALYHLGIGGVLGSLPWHWQIEVTGSAALFLAEDTIDDMHRALHKLGEHLLEDDRKKLTKMLRVFPLAGLRPILLELNGNRLLETSVYDWVMGQIDRLPQPVAFIGIDPALGITEGDEMSPAHQRRLGEMVDRIAIESGACTVLTTHAAKAINSADELGSHSSRGSGAITDAVRAEFTLRNMTADEARKFGIADIVDRKRYVQLAATKGNRLPPEAYAPVWMARGDGGALSEVSLEQVERGSVGTRELAAHAILVIANQTGETSMKFWLAQCRAEDIIPAGSFSAQEKTMERIRNALRDAGMVAKGTARGLWVPT